MTKTDESTAGAGANEDDDPVEEEELRGIARPPSKRTFETALLAEFQIRSGGDGRIVEAYAVPFDEPAEVMDVEGHYFEMFKKGAFGRQIARSGTTGITVLFNHGRDILMRPVARFAMPIGKPIELREDGPGLFTATRYASTELGDEVLQLVDEGILTHQSVQFARTPAGRGTRRLRGGHRTPDGDVFDLVERTAVRLIEYGPTPIPVYAGAEVVGRRASQVFELIDDLSDEDRNELSSLLRAGKESPHAGDPDPEPEPESAHAADSELLVLRHEQLRRQHKERTP